MKIGAIIQARVGSARLPGKVLMPLPYGSDMSVLGHVVDRAQRVEMIDEVIVGTSDNKNDDKIVSACGALGVPCFRGSEQNVLSRYYNAAKNYNLDNIVRLTGDNPCIDPLIIRDILRYHVKTDAAYTCTTGYAVGMNVEVISFSALEIAHKEASTKYEMEHVTPYIANNPGKFGIFTIAADDRLASSAIRVTLDTSEDYALLCIVFEALYVANSIFGALEISRLFKEKPWLCFINERVVQKKIFKDLTDELKEAKRICDMQDLKRASEYLEAQIREGVEDV